MTSPDKSVELLACPFCGEEGLLVEDCLSDDPPDDTKVYHVVCASSCAMAPGIYGEEKAETAIAAWNTRATSGAVDRQSKNARSVLSQCRTGRIEKRKKR